MNYEIDHLVLGAKTLPEGIAYVERALGVPVSAGGKHANLATHNALVPLLRRRYLEIIAIDPTAPPATQARWFGLDEPAVQCSLDSGPKLLAFVVRCMAIPHSLAGFPTLAPKAASRGDFRWTFGFTADAARPGGGALPYFIAWDEASAHPCDRLPAPAWDLQSIEIHAPRVLSIGDALMPLRLREIAAVEASEFLLAAQLTCGANRVTLLS